MSHETQTQIQTQEQTQAQTPQKIYVEVRKPTIEVGVVAIPKKLYNLIRSFVESSSKSEYSWNEGYRLGNVVTFRKKGKWVLEIYTEASEPGNGQGTVIASLAGNCVDVNVVVWKARDIERVTKIEQSYLNPDDLICTYEIDKIHYTSEDAYTIAFVPDKEVPYARAILLAEVIEKFREYFEPPCK